MLLNTLRFGEVEVDEDKLVTFPAGVPGFEEYRQFVMLTPDEEMPFSFMQSTEDGDVSFIVVNPFVFFPDYDFELPVSVQNELSISREQDVMIVCIISISENDEFFLNLLAPIVLNSKEKLGKQVILHNSMYKTKHFIDLSQEEKSGGPEQSAVGEDSSC
jgi:flagellar assembly factor FliW